MPPRFTFRDDITYKDLGHKVKVELKVIGAWLYIETPIERKAINEGSLRYDGVPRNVLTYIINDHPNKIVTVNDLKNDGIRTSRDLRQIAINAGIKGYLRDVFMPVYEKDALLIKNKVTLPAGEVEILMTLMY